MKRGFTLIELLVVISIIALMSSVILVAVSGAKDKAEMATVRQRVRQYVVALQFYYSEHGGYPNPNDGRGASLSYCLGHGPCYWGDPGTSFNAESQVVIDALEPYFAGTPTITNRLLTSLPFGPSMDRYNYEGGEYRCAIAASDPTLCKAIQIYWGFPGTSAAACAPGTGSVVLGGIVSCTQTLQ